MSDDFEQFRVGAGCHAGPRWQITERPTNPSEREGTAALPYAEIFAKFCDSQAFTVVNRNKSTKCIHVQSKLHSVRPENTPTATIEEFRLRRNR